MSRAFVAKIVRTPGESRLMKLFGAAGIEAGLHQGIETHLVSDMGFGFQYDSLAPLPDPIPFDDFMGIPAIGKSDVANRLPARGSLPSPREQSRPVLLPESTIPFESLSSDRDLLDGLLALFQESGLRVRETRQLSAGVTRITVDELIAQARAREPVLVRARS